MMALAAPNISSSALVVTLETEPIEEWAFGFQNLEKKNHSQFNNA